MLKYIKLNSTAALRNCKNSFVFLLFFLALAAAIAGRADADETYLLVQEKQNFLTLENKILFLEGSGDRRKILLPETTRGVLGKGQNLFFISCPVPPPPETEIETAEKKEKAPACSGGIYNIKDEKIAVQWPLEEVTPGAQLVKLYAVENTFYILYGKKKENKDYDEGSLQLARLNMNSGDAVYRGDVYDFLADKDKVFIIEKNSDGFVLNINNRLVPLTLQGRLSILGLYDDRFLLVKGSQKKELVDVITLKNIYTFSGRKGPMAPGSANLLVSALDTPKTDTEQEDHVFYKIFVDGREEGRTSTGLATLSKSFEVSIEAGQYHKIRLERWHLDQKRRGYRRANNRLQPRSIRLFVPSKRVIRLSVTFDGRIHHTVSETVME